MNPSELYERWAPSDGAWSAWAKPVLFASGVADEEAKTAWLAARERARGRFTPPRPGEIALVLELPGADALAAALECAAVGYRPVPLVNSALGPNAVLANGPTRAGLELAVDELVAVRLRADSPPAFVLDSRRIGGEAKPRMFDNQWLVFPQDFPSAAVLAARGVRRVVVVQEQASTTQKDLSHVLVRWQRAGLAIERIDLSSSSHAPTALSVSTPSLFGALFCRLISTFALRRNAAGGFGSVVPEVTSTGTGFA
jgi:hypothetical protein